MSRTNKFRIIAWIVLVIINDDIARGQEPGSNVIVSVNNQVALDCHVNSIASTLWTRTTNGNNETLLIAKACSLSGNNTAYYSTEQAGNDSCRLIISNATMQLGGVYACWDGSSTTYRSLVTVIDTVRSIVVYNQSEIVEGDVLNISCSINYNGSSQPAPSICPSPYWTTSPGQNYTSAIYHPSANVVTVVATVRVQKPTVPIFRCNTVFDIKGNTTGYNATGPADFTVGTTTEMNVLYVPSNPSFKNESAVITNNGVPCGISVLTYPSNGNPTPTYRWYDSADLNVILSTNSTLTLAEVNRNYTCEAYNTIRNVMHKVSRTYTVSKVDCSSTDTVQCCEYPRNETTSATVDGCDNGTLCDCSQGNSELSLNCNAKTFPNASYLWIGPDGQVFHSQVYDHITMNGTYVCTAYFNRTTSNYTGDVIFPIGTNDTTVLRCSVGISQTTAASVEVVSRAGMVVEIVIVCFLGVNILMICIFIGYYAFNGNSSETSERNGVVKTGRNKIRLNKRFPWLLKMLPWLNDTNGTAETNVLWVLLFALLGTSTGIVTFPVLIGIAIKSEENDETWDLNKRDNVKYENTGNGRSPSYPPSPTDKRTKASHREDPYLNIELNNSLHSIDHYMTDSPTSNASIRGKPPPAPKKNSTVNFHGCSNDCALAEPATANNDPTTYAELPIIPGIAGPTISPVQLLVTNMPNDTYAVLNQT